MDKVDRAPTRAFRVAVLSAACLGLFLLGVAGLAGAQPTESGGEPGRYATASEDFPLGTKLMISYPEGSVVVRVDDPGPLGKGVDLDLSNAAANEIGLPLASAAVVEVMTATPQAPLGPLPVTVQGGSVESTGGQQVSVSSRNSGVTIWVDGVKIVANEKPVEMVAASTGRMSESSALETTEDPALAEEAQYAREEQYSQEEQYAQKEQYSENRAEAEQYDDVSEAEDAGLPGEAADGTSGPSVAAGSDPVTAAGSDPVEEEAGRRETAAAAGQGNGSRTGGAGPRLLPATGGLPLAGAIWAGLLSMGLVGLLIRKTVR